MQQATLQDEVYVQVVKLCDAGDQLFHLEIYDEAMEKYEEALELLPEPKHIWEAATWIYAAIGDVQFQMGEYEACASAMRDAVKSLQGEENPFVQLRLGQSLCEVGETEEGLALLKTVFESEGEVIFEDEDPKYREMVSKI